MALFTYEQLHSSLNHRMSKSLFQETCPPGVTPLMTLGRAPKGDLVVLRDIFIELVTEDPSEYTFAEYVFGDYAYWEKITQAKFIQPYLKEWRLVTDVKRKSKAFKSVIDEVEKGGRSSFTAAKFLIDEPWKDKRNPKAKEESRKTTEQAASPYKDDVERLRENGFIQ